MDGWPPQAVWCRRCRRWIVCCTEGPNLGYLDVIHYAGPGNPDPTAIGLCSAAFSELPVQHGPEADLAISAFILGGNEALVGLPGPGEQHSNLIAELEASIASEPKHCEATWLCKDCRPCSCLCDGCSRMPMTDERS